MTFEYKERGIGEALIFLHGYLGDNSIWDEYIKFFSKSKRCISINLNLETSEVSKPLSIPEYGSKVLDFLKQKSITSFHLVGHSMGGYIALEVAKLKMKKIKSLTLINSSGLADSVKKQLDRDRAMKIIRLDKNKYVQLCFSNLFSKNQKEKFSEISEHWTKIGQKLKTNQIICQLTAIRNRNNRIDIISNPNIKKLFIFGKYDPIVKMEDIQYHLKVAQNYKSELLHCGHMAFEEKKEQVIQIVNKFIHS